MPPATTTIKIGLIGCGGRGTGAAEPGAAAPRATSSWSPWPTPSRTAWTAACKNLEKKATSRSAIDVPEDRRFVGFDAYQKVIDAASTW